MKILSARLHGYLDYLTVFIFAVTPSLAGISGFSALVAYVLAVVHLAMTLLTRFPLGVVRVVPFKLHGLVELIVGPVLLVLPFLIGLTGTARIFYIVMGVIIIVVGRITTYDDTPAA